ncbi:MAG: AMP-binding protein, partial [bacterium]|nr:AMP-binding protein [bacterium]
LPFDKRFTLNYQASFLNEYFLSPERLKHVLPFQVRALTEREVVEKYDSYLPTEIGSFDDLLQFTGLKGELTDLPPFKQEESVTPVDLNAKIKKAFEKGGAGYEINETAYADRKDKRETPDSATPLRLLLLDLSQYFSGDSDMLYDVVEPPLGLMYILTHLKSTYGDRIEGKIAKSRLDFDDYGQLKQLLEEFKPDVIGMRTLTFYKDFFHQTAAVMREWGVDVPIIAGGPYAGSDYINLLQDRNIDIAVPGEGELIASGLIEKILENGNTLPAPEILETIPGLAFSLPQNDKFCGGPGGGFSKEPPGRRRQDHAAEILLLDHLNLPAAAAELAKKTAVPEGKAPAAANGNDPAYLIFTSGSTGLPKGAVIEHRNVVRLLFNDNNLFDFTARDTWTMFHSYCFDFSVWEMYGSLLYGGKLVMVPRSVARDTAAYLALLRREKVSVLNQTPSAFYTLMELELQQAALKEGGGEPLDGHLRTVIFGGEALAPLKLKEWYKLYPGIKLINMFGITETTVHVTYKEIGDTEIDNNISNIGVPIPTLVTYVLNDRLQPLPPGVPGELCVGGEGVGRGYLNRPLLTSEKFTANPFIPGGMLYRSGDLVRLLDNGDMDYLGRIDHQIQVRGFRIELGEIQDRMLKHKSINDAVIIAHPTAGICAYYVAKGEVENAEIKNYLLLELPEYMVPSFFIPLETIPLTPNGKVDRKALPEPREKFGGGVAPRDCVEKQLAVVWREVLDMEDDRHESIHDNFFELGGHSLKATTLVAQIHRSFDVRLPLADLFENPTIEELAKLIKKTVKTEFISVEAGEKRDTYPLSPAQARLYFMQSRELLSTAYNIPIILILEGDLDKDKLKRVFEKIVQRHESYRTSFIEVEGKPCQRIHEKIEFLLETPGKSTASAEEAVKAFIRPFKLHEAPLFRLGLMDMDDNSHLLMWDMHHIITDGFSMGVFIKDFTALYGDAEPEPVSLHYRDYSLWSNDESVRAGGETFWLEQFRHPAPLLDIPTDSARAADMGFEGGTVDFHLDEKITAALKQLTKEEGGTIFSSLLGLYTILLHHLSSAEDIVVGTAVTGRKHADLENIVGMFVNTLALRNYPRGDMSCRAFLKEVGERTVQALDNQDYQFQDLVEKLNLPRRPGRTPLFDVMFELQNIDMPEIHLQGLTLKGFPYEGATSKFDLCVICSEADEKIYITMNYNKALFHPETVRRFADGFETIAEAVSTEPDRLLGHIEVVSGEDAQSAMDAFNEDLEDE